MRWNNLGLTAMVSVLTAMPALAQKPSFVEMKKEVRLKWIIDQAAEYELRVAKSDKPKADKVVQTPPLRREKPLLRFNDNLSGVVDAVLFAWVEDGRPEAAASFWFRKDGQKTHEFVSLSRKKIEAKRDKDVLWSTAEPGLIFEPVPTSPIPSDAKSLRMTQMRQIARRFTAAATVDNREFNLRLLPQPMMRYKPKSTQIVDGAIFNFAKGTNPEVLLVVEATVDSDGKKQFEYAPVRMTSRDCWLILDKKKVWSVPFDFGSDPSGTYRNVVSFDRGGTEVAR